jgi:starch synthase (maltosyl-transferring)
MVLHDNDRWTASFTPPKVGRYVYAIEAWTDVFASWRRDFVAKRAAGMDVGLEIEEGRNLLADIKVRNSEQARLIRDVCRKPDIVENPAALLSEDLAAAASKGQQSDLTRSATYPLVADRPIARAGAWYEMMPRSQSPVPDKHGTFDDCINRLPDIAAMGFDVLYLTPIHPIGRINRKGRNNSLRCEPGDPGSPYAIGSAEGGHDAVHPELGTLDDFRRLVRACADDNEGLWKALRDVVLFWVAQGVRIFRVDNPHTKAFAFWEWLIREVQSVDADVIFLSEAFTRPKIMKALAKLGFSQSYTYFTWRTGKEELQAYVSEITRYPEREYLRPNFFVNTPDILPFHLQSGEPWIFKARVALAATLSGNYGIYNGFELLITGEGHDLEWGGVRLRIDQQQDPALLFRCFT